jgi:hypothetical protein
VAANPKSETPATRFAALYMVQGAFVKGAQFTLGALLQHRAYTNAAKLFYADLAWDCNHGFVTVAGVNGQ